MLIKLSRRFFGWPMAISIGCILLASFLIFRTIKKVNHQPLPIPRETNVTQIQSWMSVKYISRAYNIPEVIILGKLAITNQKEGKLPLRSLAKLRGQNTQDLIYVVSQVILDFQKDFPPMTPVK